MQDTVWPPSAPRAGGSPQVTRWFQNDWDRLVRTGGGTQPQPASLPVLSSGSPAVPSASAGQRAVCPRPGSPWGRHCHFTWLRSVSLWRGQASKEAGQTQAAVVQADVGSVRGYSCPPTFLRAGSLLTAVTEPLLFCCDLRLKSWFLFSLASLLSLVGLVV